MMIHAYSCSSFQPRFVATTILAGLRFGLAVPEHCDNESSGLRKGDSLMTGVCSECSVECISMIIQLIVHLLSNKGHRY